MVMSLSRLSKRALVSTEGETKIEEVPSFVLVFKLAKLLNYS